jgi:hypothetical protein
MRACRALLLNKGVPFVSLEDLIKLLENRLSFNEQQRQAAWQRGDVAVVGALDADTATTRDSLTVLRAAL